MNDSVAYVMKVFPQTSSSQSQRYKQSIILNVKYVVLIVVYLALGYLAKLMVYQKLWSANNVCTFSTYVDLLCKWCRVYYHVERESDQRNSFTGTSAVSWTQGSVTFVKEFEIFVLL